MAQSCSGQYNFLYPSLDEIDPPEEAELILIDPNQRLPSWVLGSLIRTGPGKFSFDDGDFSVNHFLDGIYKFFWLRLYNI